HDKGTLTFPASRELLEEAQVVLHVEPQVADRMTEIGDPLDAHPEGETLMALRVETAVLKHDRVDHPGPEDRHPAGPRTGRAARAAADQALDVERDRRLGERVVAGPEPGLLVGAVQGLGE